MERRRCCGVASLELVPQQLAEQVVVAVPLALPVEWHHEAVGALERRERGRGPRGLEHRVAQAAAHPVQHRGVHEEPGLGFRQARQELVAEVLRHEPVFAGESLRVCRAWRPGLQRERGEVQASGPALGPPGQGGNPGRVELGARLFQQHAGLALVEPEVGHADLVQPPQRPPPGQGQGRFFPARDGNLRSWRDVLAQRGEHVEAGQVPDSVQVIECQHQRALQSRQRAPDARDTHRPDGRARAGQGVQHRRGDRLDPVNRGGDALEEQDGVVVLAVEGDPRERTRIGLGPPRQQRRLAVPGRRDHRRERQPRYAQPRDHVHLSYSARPGPRRGQLHLQQVKRSLLYRHRRTNSRRSRDQFHDVFGLDASHGVADIAGVRCGDGGRADSWSGTSHGVRVARPSHAAHRQLVVLPPPGSGAAMPPITGR